MTDGYKIKRILTWVNEEYNDMQGPCPDGFHVPLSNEWAGVRSIMSGLSLLTGDNRKIYLHLPYAGYRYYGSAGVESQGTSGNYWTSSVYSAGNGDSYHIGITSNQNASFSYSKRAFGMSIRAFKDTYIEPDSTWTVLTGTLSSAGIFWNQTDGLISITNGSNMSYTMSDKNLGATTVYSNGDTLSEANCGYYYQRGNNYGFAFTGTVTNSTTQVNASTYGPGNYYSGNTFIRNYYDWCSPENKNLRGGVTQGSGTRFVEKQIYPSTH